MAGKVAIVTGASSGMSEQLCRDLVTAGWHVLMADIQENPELSEELGNKAKYYYTDVSDYNLQAELSNAVFHAHGGIDALCANAGIIDQSSIFILSHRDSTTILSAPSTKCTDVDYKGLIYGTQLAVHFMRQNKQPGGAIIATSSIAGMHPLSSFPEYSGAKAAVLNSVRPAAPVLKLRENIRINCILPGIVPMKVISAKMIAGAGDEITPISTVMAAYMKLLNDPTAHGQAIECSQDKHLLLPEPPFLKGKVGKRAVTVWEPLFKMVHGENPGLPDTISLSWIRIDRLW